LARGRHASGGDIEFHLVKRHREPEDLAAYLYDPTGRLHGAACFHFLYGSQHVTRLDFAKRLFAEHGEDIFVQPDLDLILRACERWARFSAAIG